MLQGGKDAEHTEQEVMGANSAEGWGGLVRWDGEKRDVSLAVSV